MNLKNDERLIERLVAMARRGTDHEQVIAERMLLKICEKHGLDIYEVMNDRQIKEYSIKVKGKSYVRIVAQIILRFGTVDADHKEIRIDGRNTLYWETTLEKYVETLHASHVLTRLYRKEQKKLKADIEMAFINKHNLFSPFPPTSVDNGEPPSLKDFLRAKMLMGALEQTPPLHKPLPSGER